VSVQITKPNDTIIASHTKSNLSKLFNDLHKVREYEKEFLNKNIMLATQIAINPARNVRFKAARK
jgi:hypothetical protein